jgi:hypothetical protein
MSCYKWLTRSAYVERCPYDKKHTKCEVKECKECIIYIKFVRCKYG